MSRKMLKIHSLSDEDVKFCFDLPKLEVHAHLNGSIPRPTIRELRDEFLNEFGSQGGNEDLVGWELGDYKVEKIDDFFPLFSSKVYRLTSTPRLLAHATKSVLEYFASENVVYLELRSTPRRFDGQDGFEVYVDTILQTIQEFSKENSRMITKLILSIDRRHDFKTAEEIVNLAISLRNDGKSIVGLDLCGDPRAGDPKDLSPLFNRAKSAGLNVTVHFAEIPDPPKSLNVDMDALRSLEPSRLGHATYTTAEFQKWIKASNVGIEMCVTSNVFCGTVPTLEEHHISSAIEEGIPFIICTDDPLVFKSSPSNEYATVLSLIPGENRRKSLVEILISGIDLLFCSAEEKGDLRDRILRELNN